MKKYIKTSINEYLNKHNDINLNDNFWKWFGASKVVENNSPIKLYHGSDKNFNSFKFDNKRGIYTSYSCFTNNDKLAESYGSIIYEVFLKIDNPYVIDGKGEYIWKVIDKKNSPDLFFDELPYSYDGIIFKNVIDFNGRPNSEYILENSDIYMVRKNTQIKSVKNDGSFDIEDPNIFS